MELKQLQYFIAVAECGSISRAARRLYISQPSLSKTISKLEDDIGCTLFVRTNAGTALNKNGKRFYLCAKSIQEELERCLKDLDNGIRQIVMLTDDERYSQWLAPIIGESAVSFQVTLETVTRQDALEGVRKNKAQLAIVHTEDPLAGMHELYHELWCVVAAHNHPILSYTHVTAGDLSNATICVCSELDHEYLTALFQENHLEHEPFLMQIGQVEIPACVVEGSAVGVIPYSAFLYFRDHTVSAKPIYSRSFHAPDRIGVICAESFGLEESERAFCQRLISGISTAWKNAEQMMERIFTVLPGQ